METYVALLQNYQTRDKIIRTICYGAGFASGGFKGKIAKDLGTISKTLSNLRLVNRLFDDIPMWTVTRTWGAADRDVVSRALTSMANLAIQLFFPIEKIAWAADNEIITLNSAPWWTAGIGFWALFLFFNILRSLRQLSIVRIKVLKLLKQRKLESPEKSGEKDADFREKLTELKTLRKKEFLMLLKNLSDITMCINWLPLGGFLWSGKLSPTRTAFFGTVSSVIGLYMSVQQFNASKSKKS